MIVLSRQYCHSDTMTAGELHFQMGYDLIESHPLYGNLEGVVHMKKHHTQCKDSMAVVDRKGDIYVNTSFSASPGQWAYALAHCLLHLAFGHFDLNLMPETKETFNKAVWNKACDIYIATFLHDTDYENQIKKNRLKL